MTGVSPDGDRRVLAEREEERHVLGEALAAARAKDGRIVAILGPAGIGKSGLVDVALELAAETGMEVLHARGHALETEFSLGVARQLFDRVLNRATAAARERLLAGPAAAAASLLTDGAPSQRVIADPQGFSAAHALYWLVVNLGERAPVLIVVDDLHWADPLSLRFLAYLANRLSGLPVTLVVAARTGARSVLLDGLVHNPSAVTLRPAPLSAHGVRTVVGASLPGAVDGLLSACARVSGGNPLLVQELVRTMRAERWALDARDVQRLDDVAAETVARAALGRMRLLSPAASALATAAAVLGDGAPLRRAAALAGLEAAVAVEAADALVGAEILAGVEPLAFEHAVVRQTIYRELADAARADAHLRAARLLAAEQAPTETVAAQLLRARTDAAPWAAEVLSTAAASAAARGDQRAAARYLRRAIDEPPPADLRGEVLLALGRAQAALGAPEASEHLARALESTRDRRRRAEILLETGRCLTRAGQMTGAAGAFADALDELTSADARAGAHDDELALELRASRALAAIYATDDAAVAAEAEADDIVAAGRAPRTRGERLLLATLAGVHVLRGEDRSSAVELARRAWDGGALLESETADSVSAYTPCFALASAGEPGEAERMCDAALRQAQDRGSPMGYANACYWRLQVRYRLGRLTEAAADGEATLEAVAHGWTLAGPGAAGLLAICLADRGELERAAATLARFPPGEPAAQDATSAYFHEAAAHIALAAGDPTRALKALGECERLTAAARSVNPAALDWRSPAAVAHAALGEHGRARELAGENVTLARRFGEQRALGIALRAAGLVAGGNQRGTLLAEAVAVLRGATAPLELARALLDLGAHIRRSGARRDSREPLREAQALAERCQAGALRRRADQELAASGARPRRTALRGPDALTPSELRVASLAAGGMTTREIAQALFVTPKTVEKHISGAYDKLEIRSRDALAHALQSEPTR